MRIPHELYDQMVAHADDDKPLECCGLIAGKDGEATRVLRVRNAETRERHYSMDPNDQHRVWKSIEDGDEDLLAIYHSHPPAGAYFSETDVDFAFVKNEETGEEWLAWPGVLYVVIGLQDSELGPRGVKAFRVDGERTVTEVPLDVV